MRRIAAVANAAALLLLAVGLPGARADSPVQLGAKLVASDGGPAGWLGVSAALSADGRTLIAGAPREADGRGAAWVFVESGGRWVQQGAKLVPSDAVGAAGFGFAAALSGDGDTALVGGLTDDGDRGAAWIFTRTGNTWTQVGDKLLPADPAPEPNEVLFGKSVALSADGSTALVGGWGDGFGYGAAWVFTSTGGSWTQQGPKLTAPDEMIGDDGHYSWFGSSVALSADGDTAVVGAEHDDSRRGAAWAFTRAGGIWSQHGPKLRSADAAGRAELGSSVALDADGTTALIGGRSDGAGVGAAWTFERGTAGWSQAGAKLAPPDASGPARFGDAVALSGSGDDALVGGYDDNGGDGAAWAFRRSGGAWTPRGAKLVPSDAEIEAYVGDAVGLSDDADTLLISGSGDWNASGAAWIFGTTATPLTVPRLSAGGDWMEAELGEIEDGVELADGDAPTGTLTFDLHGPDAADCSEPPISSVTIPVAGNDYYLAEGLVAGAVGTYWMRYRYSGDTRNHPTATACVGKIIDVRARPRLVADVSAHREVGRPLTIAIFLADGLEPSGEISLAVYKPSDPNCQERPVLERVLDLVDGRVPTVEYIPADVGKLHFSVFYEGDAQNLEDFLPCEHDLATIEIGRAAPALAMTTAGPVAVGDPIAVSAVVVGGYRPGGTMRFTLFPPSDPTCSGAPAGIVGEPLVGGAAASGAFATTATGTHNFVAEYSGDAHNDAARSACGAAGVTASRRRPRLVVSSRASAADGGTLSETATLHDGFAPSGNVVFTLFGPDDARCRQHALLRVLTSIVDGRATTGLLGPVEPGRYGVIVRYAGDANNHPVATGCDENDLVIPGARAVLRRVAPAQAGAVVSVQCVGTRGSRCHGGASLVAPRRRRRGGGRSAQTVGRTRYRVDARRTKTFRVRLTRASLRAARAQRWRSIKVVVRIKRHRTTSVIGRRSVRLLLR